jgi:hypothetical protein
MAGVLRRLLRAKFGRLDARVSRRLDEASFEKLELWAVRVIEAARLSDVFEPRRARRNRSG